MSCLQELFEIIKSSSCIEHWSKSLSCIEHWTKLSSCIEHWTKIIYIKMRLHGLSVMETLIYRFDATPTIKIGIHADNITWIRFYVDIIIWIMCYDDTIIRIWYYADIVIKSSTMLVLLHRLSSSLTGRSWGSLLTLVYVYTLHSYKYIFLYILSCYY